MACASASTYLLVCAAIELAIMSQPGRARQARIHPPASQSEKHEASERGAVSSVSIEKMKQERSALGGECGRIGISEGLAGIIIGSLKLVFEIVFFRLRVIH